MDYTYQDISKMIDHSLLNPTLTADDLEAGCQLALAYDVASVCIMPYYLKRCAELLAWQLGHGKHDDWVSARRTHHRNQAGRSHSGRE